MEDGVVGRVAKVHVKEAHVTGKRRVGDGAVVVGVLPCPALGALEAFLKLAGSVLAHVDQGNVALVRLGLLVNEREDALGARKAHDHEVNLLGDLANGAREALREVEERHHDVDGECDARDGGVVRSRGEHGAASQCNYHVGEVAHVHEDGAKGVAIDVRSLGGIEELVVDLVEALLGGSLVREDLDDLLAVHGFLGEALLGSERTLLGEEEVSRTPTHYTGDHDHQDDHRKYHERQGHRVPEHDDENRDHRREHGDEVRHGNANELAKGIHVVGVVRHDVAVLVRVEVADGQVLHVVEHLVAGLHEGALADHGRELRLSDVRAQGNHIAPNEAQDDVRDLDLRRPPVSRAHELLHHRDCLLHEDRGQ